MKKTQRQLKLSVIQPPSVGPSTGAAIRPIPNVVIASVCSLGGKVSSRIACESGIIAAPAAPWSTRKTTIWWTPPASPHMAEVTTNINTEARK